jgi:hypothetical protein
MKHPTGIVPDLCFQEPYEGGSSSLFMAVHSSRIAIDD